MNISGKYIYWVILFSIIFLTGLISIEDFQDDPELCDSNIGYCLNEDLNINSNSINNYKIKF